MAVYIQENQKLYLDFLKQELWKLIESEEKPSQSFLENIADNRDLSSSFFLAVVQNFVNKYYDESYDEELFGNDLLYWSIIFLAYLREPEVFEIIIPLCSLDDESIDIILGDMFITESLAFVLALTGCDRFELLEPIIENDSVNIFIRNACLRAGSYMLAIQNDSKALLFRDEFVSYLNKLLQDCINTPPREVDDEWCSCIISVCGDIGAVENLELIKDAFSFQIADKNWDDIDGVLEDLNKNKDACIAKLKGKIDDFLLSHLTKSSADRDDANLIQKQNLFMENLEKLSKAIDIFLPSNLQAKLGRNDLCFCGSGKKYKKCCLITNNIPSSVSLEICQITSEPLYDDEFEVLPDEDKDILHTTYKMDPNNIDKICMLLEDFILRHPNVKMAYNHLFAARMYEGKYYLAMDVLEKTLKKFPGYLFALTGYGDYYLRRGEPEKIPHLFNNCWTLKQLYPKRDVFHVTEFKAFNLTMARFFTATGDLEKAKIYFTPVQRMNPKDDTIHEIYINMRRKLMDMKPDQYPTALSNLII